MINTVEIASLPPALCAVAGARENPSSLKIRLDDPHPDALALALAKHDRVAATSSPQNPGGLSVIRHSLVTCPGSVTKKAPTRRAEAGFCSAFVVKCKLSFMEERAYGVACPRATLVDVLESGKIKVENEFRPAR